MLTVVLVACQIATAQCDRIWLYKTMDECRADIAKAWIEKPQWAPLFHCRTEL